MTPSSRPETSPIASLMPSSGPVCVMIFEVSTTPSRRRRIVFGHWFG